MSKCFQCGAAIAPESSTLRRKVKTGEQVRRGSSGRFFGPTTVRFGMRVVCARCAKRLDREWQSHEFVQKFELGLAVLLLLAVIVFDLMRQ